MPLTKEPTVNVGIMEAETIEAELHGCFTDGNGHAVTGKLNITSPMVAVPANNDCTFSLKNVKIGIGFHWEQMQQQSFQGALRVIKSPSGKLIAINEIPVEQYLRSVISSEMNANAPEEFLKTHAVISRSWLMAMLKHEPAKSARGMVDTPCERIKWYDRDDHELFDVCADDHCQRYQGIRPDMPQTVAAAIESTRGQVLTHNGDLCDARFSKCCGGAMEEFSTCWDNEQKPYLAAGRDTTPAAPLPDLTNEANARIWCTTTPESWCAAPKPELLRTVLNNYDLDTPDFYRWKVEYSARELAELLHERTGVDFGQIISLTPLHRGPSARIDRLEIRGTLHTMTIGKELEIRRSLSKSHLYSSAFVVDALDIDKNNVPGRWVLHGAGWGHGVGLCQIGAAAMAAAGHDYQQILDHYYPQSQLSTLYL